MAVVSRTRKAFSVTREYPVIDDDTRAMRFFRDVDEAERWIDDEVNSTGQPAEEISMVIPFAIESGRADARRGSQPLRSLPANDPRR